MSKQHVPSGTEDTQDHPQRGRPRILDGDDAILRATLELLAVHGLGKTTVAAVAARAGVARATIYLRWPTRDKLIAAAARHALGRPPFPLSRDLEADLRLGAKESQQILGEPVFLAIFPELVRAVMAIEPEVTYDDIAPNRRTLSLEYQELAAAAGFRSDIDPTIPVDLFVGAQINHVLATGRPTTPEVGDQLTEVIVAGLRAPK